MEPRNRRTVTTRWLVGALAGVAAVAAVRSEVASLNQAAGDHLGFPDGQEWTLPAVVTVATVAGALMWTVLEDDDLRKAGRRLNVTFTVISSFAVALDHLAASAGWWKVPGFAGGALIPAAATWLTHLLARLTEHHVTRDGPRDETGRVPTASDRVPDAAPRETGTSSAGGTEPPSQLGTEPVTEPPSEPATEPETKPVPVPLHAVPQQPPTQIELAMEYIRTHGDTYRTGITNRLGEPISKGTHNRARTRLRKERTSA